MSNNGTAQHRTRVCIIGAGPSGMSTLYHFAALPAPPEIVCFEKQKTFGGLWNYTWLTGTDQYGEPNHGGMYKHLWSNGPKECLEFPEYTFEKHFGKQVPSFPPRPVLRNYLEGRFRSSPVDLTKYIKFQTVVRNVKYIDQSDEFMVTWLNLQTNVTTTEMFSHVIVAVGIFNFPNKPSFPEMENFPGRILHSHDFRSAEEFSGQRLLIVGASYSAEDIALQTKKYGAKNVICTWRTKPMGFKWPKGIEERPLVQKFEGRTAYFQDGSSAEFDCIILCTGYIYHFPFLEDDLRLRSKLTVFPDHLYKGTVYLEGGNNKLFYMGLQDQYYSFTMFDVMALWVSRYIMGTLNGEPKNTEAMKKEVKMWVSKRQALKDCHDDIDFQSDFIADLCRATGYNEGVVKSRAMFHDWEHHRKQDITTYRDKCFTSIFSGTKAPQTARPWYQAFDDSIESFVGK